MLDSELAALYEVPVKALNQAVKRNLDRFPEDFMFQLSQEEATSLRSQSVTSRPGAGAVAEPMPSPKQGVACFPASAQQRAVHVNMNHAASCACGRCCNKTPTRPQLAALERKYDGQFKMVFEPSATDDPGPRRSPHGFRRGDRDAELRAGLWW